MPDWIRESLSFDEKIALAELEVSKAIERVRDLQYQKARFCLDAHVERMKTMQPSA